MSIGWDYVSELLPTMGLLSVPQIIHMRVESHGGMILTGENQRSWSKPSPITTLSTINPTRTKLDLCGERPVTNHLSLSMACCFSWPDNCIMLTLVFPYCCRKLSLCTSKVYVHLTNVLTVQNKMKSQYKLKQMKQCYSSSKTWLHKWKTNSFWRLMVATVSFTLLEISSGKVTAENVMFIWM
jgi:hypothetical protein